MIPHLFPKEIHVVIIVSQKVPQASLTFTLSDIKMDQKSALGCTIIFVSIMTIIITIAIAV